MRSSTICQRSPNTVRLANRVRPFFRSRVALLCSSRTTTTTALPAEATAPGARNLPSATRWARLLPPTAWASLVLLAAATSVGCNTTTVNSISPAGEADGGAVVPRSICERLAQLACAQPVETCLAPIESELAVCSGTEAQKQAVLDCLYGASYDCGTGKPMTTQCRNEALAAGCPPDGTVAPADGGMGTPDGGTGKPSEDGGNGSGCGGLCVPGVATTYHCIPLPPNTFNATPFDIVTSPITASCGLINTKAPACSATVTSGDTTNAARADFSQTYMACDGRIIRPSLSCDQQFASWSLSGDTLHLLFNDFSATCNRL